MDILSHVGMAFSVALEPVNLLLCFVGVLCGTLVGVLPGLGPATTIALLLPATFSLTAVQSMIMLAGIFYGALYGGSTTSILVNIPGEAASVVTCLDGYQMARKGRAGPALAISAIGSFVGGTFAIVMTMFLAPPLSEMALKFGFPEKVALLFFGFTMVTYLSRGSMAKALMMAAAGLLLSTIGTDLISASPRFTLGILELQDGIGIVPVVMGLFGISEILLNVEQSSEKIQVFKAKVSDLFLTKKDWKDSAGPVTRGTLLGFLVGLFPGAGGVLPSFFSYALEKRISKHPETFGKGEIAGVAGPETANNAGGQASFIPLLTLGLPCTPSLAIMMGALMIHGLAPGPLLMKENPDLFWGTIGSMYIGNAMLVLLNLPLIGVWVKILKVPYFLLAPLILLICLIGAYSLNNSMVEVGIMAACGLLGYAMKKFSYEPAPLVLALVLGPMFEESLRQSLILSNGNPMIFLTRPIAAVLVVIAIMLLISPFVFKQKSRLTGGEED
ncbi:MAG: tripartite tricarboxylate transporter permease [Deltaproteobacteria bacterium]|nr:tripartite tricarboxylate transporter permease [Deltaproteobacteria bacterium]